MLSSLVPDPPLFSPAMLSNYQGTSQLAYTVADLPPVALVVKNPPANAGDMRDTVSMPGSERSPGERNGNPLQCPCLENPMDRGAWQATVHGVAKSQA